MIRRHFCNVNGRQIHYRRAGCGPPVLLIHPSLRSSDVFIEFIEHLASKFTVIAPDTPGYGYSDPLPQLHPKVADYADSLLLLLDALGIKRVGVYGFLTGSYIAMSLSQRYPARVSVAVLNNYLLFSSEERQDYLENFVPELQLSWDGAHLTWVWARVREQAIFFPWHKRTIANRVDADLPEPKALHSRLLNFLNAGTKYHLGPKSVFQFDAAEALSQCKAITFLLYSVERPRNIYFDRLPELPANVEAEQIDGLGNILTRVVDVFSEYPGDFCPGGTEDPNTARSKFVMIDGRHVHVMRHGEGGEPLLVLHGDAGAVAGLEPECEGFANGHQVIAVDFPGHGLSDDPAPGASQTIQHRARILATVLKEQGVHEVDVAGFGGGGVAALELTRQMPGLIRSLALLAPLCPPGEELKRYEKCYAPRIVPEWSGGYLLTAWHFIRDQQFFDPWFDKTRASIVWNEPEIDNIQVHRRTLDLLRCLKTFQGNYAETLRYPIRQVSGSVDCPTVIGTGVWNPRDKHARDLANRTCLPVVELGADRGTWSQLWAGQRVGAKHVSTSN